MFENATKEILDEVTRLDGEIVALQERRNSLIQVLSLLEAKAVPVQFTVSMEVPTATAPRTYKKKTKKRPQWKPHSMPWAPRLNSNPFMQEVYDFLAKGDAYTTKEVWQHIIKTHPDVREAQVSSGLSHMRKSGRLMQIGNTWKRKYVTRKPGADTSPEISDPPTVEIQETITAPVDPVNADSKQKQINQEVRVSLKKLAEQGKLILVRESQNGSAVYALPGSFGHQGA